MFRVLDNFSKSQCYIEYGGPSKNLNELVK